jgi:hypothetical protein
MGINASRRIVVRGLDGLTRIVATADQLPGFPALIAYGAFQQAKLTRVEKRYALYTEVAPAPDPVAAA